ncbi:hypothetical protein J2W34_005157 [Variovorax boronicumulans]|uniref:hypothetical protein n=1 Tax=Variovorax boronicumulans TaxID=436515 RepID=UPI002781A2D0|nr:hypothetical protein [Variovorax boronicumulans]MDQ0073349.1 hypothetical protein [Variovorax boronicumulans]
MTDDQLSTFVIVHENRGNGGIVSFESISDANGSLLRQQNQMTENLRSIKAPPGTYWVTLRVWGYGYTTAFPRTQITAEAGRTYQFSSNSSKNGMAVNATYQAVSPASR